MKLVPCLVWGFCFLLLNGAEGQEKITFSDGKKCDLDGTAKSEAGKALNRLKNRFHIPQAADIDHDGTLAAIHYIAEILGQLDLMAPCHPSEGIR